MIDTAGAQRALTLITTDMDARQRLLAHYRGDEDPVSALRELLDPAQPSAATIARLDRAARLQSVAYGRAATTDDHEAAARAQDELAWDRAHAAEIREEIEAAVEAFLAERDATASSTRVVDGERSHSHVESQRRRKHSIRTLWLVPVAVAALAVGGIAGGFAPSLIEAKATPSPTPSPTHSTRFLSGASLDARMKAVLLAITNQNSVDVTRDADAWFLTAQSAEDRASPASIKADVTPDSIRLVSTGASAGGGRVWISKTPSHTFCISLEEEDQEVASTCTETSEFTSDLPLQVQLGPDIVIWEGATIIQSRTIPTP